MAKQLGFYVNTSMCSGCKACASACKDLKDLDTGVMYRKVRTIEGSNTQARTYNVSMACNHCEEPACMAFCPQGAISKRTADGIVIISSEKCINCGTCLESCPYRAPVRNAAKTKVSKCDFCIDLQAQGESPACVAACPQSLIKCDDVWTLRKKYGNLADIKGIPDSDATRPNIVFTPHKNSL